MTVTGHQTILEEKMGPDLRPAEPSPVSSPGLCCRSAGHLAVGVKPDPDSRPKTPLRPRATSWVATRLQPSLAAPERGSPRARGPPRSRPGAGRVRFGPPSRRQRCWKAGGSAGVRALPPRHPFPARTAESAPLRRRRREPGRRAPPSPRAASRRPGGAVMSRRSAPRKPQPSRRRAEGETPSRTRSGRSRELRAGRREARGALVLEARGRRRLKVCRKQETCRVGVAVAPQDASRPSF